MNISYRILAVSTLSICIALSLLAWGASGSRKLSTQKKTTRYFPVAASPNKQKTITYARHIAPILYKNCASCHQPGAVAPFSLRTYDDTKKRAKQIAYVTRERIMPPWKADEGAEKFHNARRLSDEEISLIQSWHKAGAPRGDAKAEPKAPPMQTGWPAGKPDAVYDIGAEYSVPAEGNDIYRCFVIPTNFAGDRYVSMLQVLPDNRRAVHHVIAYLDTKGAARQLDAKDATPGFESFGGPGFDASGALGGWAPGNDPQRLPDGTGFLLPKGADIVLQVHYHPTGKAETDRTKIGLSFARGAVDKMVRILPIAGHPLRIPAGEKNYISRGSFPVMFNATLLGVMPHMHLLGQEMDVHAKLPDGTVKKLVRVPQWDFNWQTSYVFKKPVPLPSGTTIEMKARFDNSSDNPFNPSNPPKEVGWGEETTDEMCIAFIVFTLDAEHLAQRAAS